MKYLSVCSGIEAATVAWHPLGWQPVAFGEIEKFPCQVLAHHYPDTPNWGDMTKFKEWPNADIDVFVGGTPCQSFSVAGLRKGLDDPRGNLMLTYLAIAARYRPRWLVWENVPGVLSSNGGLDFASLLRGMGELGYGFAYRILDAQYFGVAQRRRRVFVVGYLGNWRPAAAVLFERHSLCGYPAPSRKAREDIANCLTKSPSSHSGFNPASSEGNAVIVQPIALAENTIGRKPENGGNGDGFSEEGPMYTLNATGVHGVAQPIAFAQNQRDEVRIMAQIGALAAEPGMKQQTYIAQPIPFDTTQITSPQNGNNPKAGDPCHPLAATAHVPAIAQPTIVHGTQDPCVSDIAFAQGRNNGGENVMVQAMAVRRLTPKECERLQGFPDNYTDIKPKGKATPDGPRYKALGNSMAVPVMAWIGKRIQEVDAICQTQKQ